jgi:hypothetical protein
MRRGFTLVLAWAAVSAIAVAGIAAAAEKPTVIQVGNLILTFNGGFSPKALPKAKRVGITLNVSGKIETKDKTHPPALGEFILEADKNGAINAKGLPVCTSGKLQAQDTPHAEAACPTAIVGEGKTDIEVEFPESPPFIAHSKLVAFNGGVSGGKTTIFIHAFLSSPVSAAVVTTVKVSTVHEGRFGLKSIATIPKIAGGYGSAISFNLKLGRAFTYKGKKQNYLLLQCPDGKIFAQGTAKFSDNVTASGGVIRACTPKG